VGNGPLPGHASKKRKYLIHLPLSFIQRAGAATKEKQMPNNVYSTKVTATGGRHGSIRSDDGLLDLKLALPKTLGGKGDATNPEQLFAGGYAACFENALFHVSREARRHFADSDIEVVAQIGLSRNDSGAFVLSAALAVTMAGVDQKTAEQFVEGAHAICPYSNAIKGNVDVQIAVSVR
jgi:Ohr subfamily peroxiredoxin